MACLTLWEGDREESGGEVVEELGKVGVEEKERDPDEITRWID